MSPRTRKGEDTAAVRPPGELVEGGICPACGQGVLFKIGQLAEGVLLKCFMCNRQQSVHDEHGADPPVSLKRGAPSGMVLSRGQSAAAGATDPEAAIATADAHEGADT